MGQRRDCSPDLPRPALVEGHLSRPAFCDALPSTLKHLITERHELLKAPGRLWLSRGGVAIVESVAPTATEDMVAQILEVVTRNTESDRLSDRDNVIDLKEEPIVIGVDETHAAIDACRPPRDSLEPQAILVSGVSTPSKSQQFTSTAGVVVERLHDIPPQIIALALADILVLPETGSDA
jgi:hypothetical protein